MEDLTALMDYFKKIQRMIENADLTLLKYKFLKKSRVDDLLVCTIAKLPDSFKKAMKARLRLDLYPSVSCFNRLSRLMKRPFFLNKDYYIVDYNEAYILIKSIRQSIEKDINNLERSQV